MTNTRPPFGEQAASLRGPLFPVIPRPRRAAPLQSQANRWIRRSDQISPRRAETVP